MDTVTPITVGSSDVAAVLGISPWAKPSQAWARLTGLVPRYGAGDTPATRRGRIMESAILDEWARLREPVGRTPGPAISEPPRVRDGWKHAREDMLAIMPDGSRVIVEAKTTRGWDGWGESGTADVPVYYAAQVLWQLHVLDLDAAELVAYCPMDDGLRIYQLARRRDLEARVVSRVERWMTEHVWCDPPVPPPDLTLDVVEAMHASGPAKDWLDPDDSIRALAKELAAAREALRAAEVEEARLRSLVCQRIGDNYGIRSVATWGRVAGRESVSLADIRTFAPDTYATLAEQNLIKRASSSRQFRFTYKDQP